MDENIPEATRPPLSDRTQQLTPTSPVPWTIDGPTIKDALGAVVCTWQISGRDPQPWHRADAQFIVGAANALERDRIRELMDSWSDYYNAATPVRQADALLAFSNAMYHFGVEITDDISWLDEDARTDEVDVHVDLRDEDEDGVLRHTAAVGSFDPARVHPGAVIAAGRESWHEPRRVRAMELSSGVDSDVVVITLERLAPAPSDLPNDF